MHPEKLSIEIWIEIFDYLTVKDVFQAFTNLNKYFDDILTSKHLSFKIQLQAEDNDHIEHLPTIYFSHAILDRIICLKSSVNSSYDYFPEFIQNHAAKLTRLQSLLIKANTKETPSICSALQQLNTLRYLSLTCIPNQNLLESILASRSLRKCNLHFWRVTTPIDYHLGINSDIEILRIKLQDSSNHSIMNLLLSHMPKLKILEIIEENFINNNSHPLFDRQLLLLSNLEILKLTWGYHNIQSNCFQPLITTMPRLKHLYLTMSYYTLNETLFDNLIDRIRVILEGIKPIKISIFCRRLKATAENNLQTLFDNYCQEISRTINARSTTRFEVKWFEENSKKHKIEII